MLLAPPVWDVDRRSDETWMHVTIAFPITCTIPIPLFCFRGKEKQQGIERIRKGKASLRFPNVDGAVAACFNDLPFWMGAPWGRFPASVSGTCEVGLSVILLDLSQLGCCVESLTATPKQSKSTASAGNALYNIGVQTAQDVSQCCFRAIHRSLQEWFWEWFDGHGFAFSPLIVRQLEWQFGKDPARPRKEKG